MFPALSSFSACHLVAKIRCWRLLLLFSLYSPIFVLLDGGILVLTPATPPFTNLIAIAVISQIRFQKPPVLPWVLDRLRTLAAIGCSRCDCSPGCVVQIGSRPRWQGVFPPSSLLLLSCMRFQHGVCGGLAVHRGQHHSNISIHIATDNISMLFSISLSPNHSTFLVQMIQIGNFEFSVGLHWGACRNSNAGEGSLYSLLLPRSTNNCLSKSLTFGWSCGLSKALLSVRQQIASVAKGLNFSALLRLRRLRSWMQWNFDGFPRDFRIL